MRWEDCVKRGLERVGGEWRTTAKDGIKRQQMETVDRECSERKVRKEKAKKNMTVTMATSPPGDRNRDQRKTTTNDYGTCCVNMMALATLSSSRIWEFLLHQ